MSKFESFATVSCPRCALIAYVTCLRVKFMGQTTSAEKYSIFGEDMQVVALNLGADEKVTCEPGSMVYMTDDIKPSCDNSGCFNRCMSGNPCCMSVYTGDGKGVVGQLPISCVMRSHHIFSLRTPQN